MLCPIAQTGSVKRTHHRPGMRKVSCPKCGKRLKSTWRDMHPDEPVREWIEYIPRHQRKER
jgi:hypothetical protein